MTENSLAAVFMDFENFYYSLTNLYQLLYEEANQLSISFIGKTLGKLRVSTDNGFIIRQACAAWSELVKSKNELQKMGNRAVDALSNVHKNRADIQLSLAAQEVVLTMTDIHTIMIFPGDHDYMPIAFPIRERGKKLHFVGFEAKPIW